VSSALEVLQSGQQLVLPPPELDAAVAIYAKADCHRLDFGKLDL
jgi:hypothetical protein